LYEGNDRLAAIANVGIFPASPSLMSYLIVLKIGRHVPEDFCMQTPPQLKEIKKSKKKYDLRVMLMSVENGRGEPAPKVDILLENTDKRKTFLSNFSFSFSLFSDLQNVFGDSRIVFHCGRSA
jgi:hypothetical protein